MLSSVLTGTHFLPNEATAAMIMLGDQPTIRSQVLDRLIRAYHTHVQRIIVPVYQGKRGHPLLFDMSFKEEVFRLDPKNGMRQLLADHPDEILEVEMDSSSVLNDIDNKQDYLNAIKGG
jgi:molybdenum cofactor cytidylyltransferase